MRTLLVAPRELEGQRLTLGGAAYRHHVRAARLLAGEAVRLVDGTGRARTGRVLTVDGRSAEIGVERDLHSGEPATALTLWAPLPRPPRASWLVEKLTEVGARTIRFYCSERAPRRPGDGTLRRLERVAAAALEQCGRSRLPELSGAHAWLELLRSVGTGEPAWVLEASGAAWDAASTAARPGIGGSVHLIVGPEGGLTAQELADLEAVGCRQVCLGPTTLRLETAAVVGTALLLQVATAPEPAAPEMRSGSASGSDGAPESAGTGDG